MPHGIIAAGAILYYLKQTEHPNLQHISSIQRIEREDFLWMDRFTIRNLELLPSGIDQSNSLIKVLDNTVSAMGARLLHRWMVFPLKDLKKINERLDAVEYFILQTDLRKNIAQAVKLCGDVERLVSKIPMKKISPREIMQLANGLHQTAIIKKACETSENPYIKRLAGLLNSCDAIAEKLLEKFPTRHQQLLTKAT